MDFAKACVSMGMRVWIGNLAAVESQPGEIVGKTLAAVCAFWTLSLQTPGWTINSVYLP
jgi:hypothetical protein